MNVSSLEEFTKEYKKLVEEMTTSLVKSLRAPKVLKEAMIYSLEAGGKRIRPLLVFAVLRAFGIDPKKGLKPAAAIEMIHTYSLIHDDLPSMDNDDLRRGKPTNHIVFGEANAILAGDALLTLAFQVISEMSNEEASSEIKLALIKELSSSAGAEGMVGGQTADIEGEGKDLSLEELEYVHQHKTGKLLSCSVISGALLAGASNEQIKNLLDYSQHLGLAFQIQDDILDVEGLEEKIGKPVGSDANNEKNTYPALLTLSGAKKKLEEHIEMARDALKRTDLDIDLLLEITDLIAKRDH